MHLWVYSLASEFRLWYNNDSRVKSALITAPSSLWNLSEPWKLQISRDLFWLDLYSDVRRTAPCLFFQQVAARIAFGAYFPVPLRYPRSFLKFNAATLLPKKNLHRCFPRTYMWLTLYMFFSMEGIVSTPLPSRAYSLYSSLFIFSWRAALRICFPVIRIFATRLKILALHSFRYGQSAQQFLSKDAVHTPVWRI